MKLPFTYNFRIVPEIAFAVAITAAVPILQGLATITGFADLTPEFWDGLLAGGFRAGIGAILALITGGGFQKPGVPADNATQINEALPAPYWDSMNESPED